MMNHVTHHPTGAVTVVVQPTTRPVQVPTVTFDQWGCPVVTYQTIPLVTCQAELPTW